MAFNSSNAQRNNASNQSNDSWKAQGFINLYLPSKKSKTGRRKLVGIPLKDSVTNDKEMREWVEKNPEKACEIILRAMTIEYQPANAEGTGFDFDAMAAA